MDFIIFPTWEIILAEYVSYSCCILSQRLAEAAEDADFYHEYNETMQVCDNMLQYKNIHLCAVCDYSM